MKVFTVYGNIVEEGSNLLLPEVEEKVEENDSMAIVVFLRESPFYPVFATGQFPDGKFVRGLMGKEEFAPFPGQNHFFEDDHHMVVILKRGLKIRVSYPGYQMPKTILKFDGTDLLVCP